MSTTELPTNDIEMGGEPSDTEAKEVDTEGKEVDTEGKEDDEGPNPKFSEILNLCRPEWPQLIFAFIMAIASETAFMLPPLVLVDGYDAVVNHNYEQSKMRKVVKRVMIWVFILHFAGHGIGLVRGNIMVMAGQRVVSRLRNDLYSSILKQEIGFFDKRKTGELVSRLGSDTTIVQLVVTSSLPEATLGLMKVIATIVLMFLITWRLTGIVVGVAFVLFFLCWPFGKWIGEMSKKYQDALGEAQTSSTEALGSMRTVRSFVGEKVEEERYKKKIGDPNVFKYWFPWKSRDAGSTYRFGVLKALGEVAFANFVFGFGILAMYVSLWYGFELVITEKLSFGRLMAFQAYIFNLAFALAQVGGHMTKVFEVMGATKRIFDLLYREPKILPNPKGCIPLPKRIQGIVTFEGVWFAYPTRPEIDVLQDFTLKVPANSTAALVGSSGCGKSTVVALIQRFYDVSKGCISIDGHDIRNFDPNDLRSFMGFVEQEPVLFGLTVRENVCYGVHRDVTDEELEDVCRQANAHEFISEFPEKYETLVGERGVRLSGGQKQRVCIARALLIDPRVLLLDEATSALDAEAEHLVQQAIEKLMKGRTTLIVAHRLSTVRDADQIVVMDENRIVGIGTHNELLAECGKYQDLIKRQTDGKDKTIHLD